MEEVHQAADAQTWLWLGFRAMFRARFRVISALGYFISLFVGITESSTGRATSQLELAVAGPVGGAASGRRPIGVCCGRSADATRVKTGGH